MSKFYDDLELLRQELKNDGKVLTCDESQNLLDTWRLDDDYVPAGMTATLLRRYLSGDLDYEALRHIIRTAQGYNHLLKLHNYFLDRIDQINKELEDETLDQTAKEILVHKRIEASAKVEAYWAALQYTSAPLHQIFTGTKSIWTIDPDFIM